MRQTSFTELVGCRLPLQLAGMGGEISDIGLSAAVTQAGGLGMLGGGGVPSDALRSTLEALSEAADGPFGVNFLMPFIDRDAVQAAARLCRVCDFHFGTPDASYIELVREGGAVAGWQIGSQEEAAAASRRDVTSSSRKGSKQADTSGGPFRSMTCWRELPGL